MHAYTPKSYINKFNFQNTEYSSWCEWYVYYFGILKNKHDALLTTHSVICATEEDKEGEEDSNKCRDEMQLSEADVVRFIT